MARRIYLFGSCLLILLIGCAGATGESAQEKWTPRYVSIKYRADPVDIGAPYFEALDRSDSSVVNDAWFDESNQYLVINLQGTAYHYCGLPNAIWNALKAAESMGSYFQDQIKGNFDCRVLPVPEYP